MGKKILIVLVSLSALFFVLKYSGIRLPDDFYYLKSPDGNKVITIVNRTYLFETKASQKNDSGYYLFYGKIMRMDTIPSKFLKLKYSDRPLYISWGDTIRLIYKGGVKNRLDKSKIDFSLHYRKSDVNVDDGKITMKSSFEMSYLDEIFRTKVDEKRGGISQQ